MSREDPDRLSADDAHILGLESAVIAGHTLKLVVLGPATSPLDVEALRTAVAERLSSQPRATQRIDTSGPELRWTEATAFEISDHVRRREEPGCASRDDLWRAVSKLTPRRCPTLPGWRWRWKIHTPNCVTPRSHDVVVHRLTFEGTRSLRCQWYSLPVVGWWFTCVGQA
nr:wax ester/triacylglycerol synthase domain-containing protein [Rhodococcus opacus]